MDPNPVDLCEIYRHYCASDFLRVIRIAELGFNLSRFGQVLSEGLFFLFAMLGWATLGTGKAYDEEGGGQHDEMPVSKFSRDSLAQLLKFVELRVHPRISVCDELQKLMSKLSIGVDFSEFSRFYEFVFFMCRENGQKNITINRAIAAWRLVLAGRFRLLNQWCDFVQEKQRHNISLDTWHQVLAFSQCVHENLEGYDPEGAWPVLIDDFVEHMYRLLGYNNDLNGSVSQSCLLDEPLPGLKIAPGLKRKSLSFDLNEMEFSDDIHPTYSSPNRMHFVKRNKLTADINRPFDDDPANHSCGNCVEANKHSPMGSYNSPCVVEGCLSRGFAGLFSTRSYLQLDRERRVSYT